MESRNPVLQKAVEQAKEANEDSSGFAYTEGKSAYGAASGASTAGMSAEQLQEMYSRSTPNAGAVRPGGVAMTLNDVMVKTGMCFAVLLVGAVIGWQTAISIPLLWIGALFVGFALAMINIFKKTISPPLVLAYAGVQGVFLGGISRWYDISFTKQGQTSIVAQAVIGTLVAFGVMLFLYNSNIIKVNGTFKKMMAIAFVSYFVIAIASLVAAMFGVGGGWGFYGVGVFGILLCMFGVGLAAFSLCLDFESIKQAVAIGVPERESWRMAFGLLATLIWLYLEILRLLAIVNGNR